MAGVNAGQDFKIDELVIHGNVARAKQAGYITPISGIDSSVNLANLQAVYPGVVTSDHFYGNPAFCMSLHITDFFRTKDGQIGFTVKKASLCEFPKFASQKSALDASGGWDYRCGSVATDGSANIDGTIVTWTGEGAYGYNTANLWARFPLPFEVWVAMLQGSTLLMEQPLFEYGGANWWDEGAASATEPLLISGTYPANPDDPITLVVLMQSTCSCNQANAPRPVFATDITTYFPDPDSYIWRRFGTSQSDDPQGYAIDSTKLDGKWHLTRPFYFVESSGSTRKWTNVEENNPEGD